MRRALFLLWLLCCLAPFGAAAKKPIEYRRTLFLTVAQKQLMLELPPGLCFFDQSSPREQALIKPLRDRVEKRGDQAFLAAFSDCNAIAGLGGADGAETTARFNSGFIAWANPMIGPETPLDLQKYLDMRSESFDTYARTSISRAEGFKVDKKPRRTASGVAITMTGDIMADGVRQKGITLLAATSLRHIPLEITLNYGGKNVLSADTLYRIVDKFMAQQIALNQEK